jgi:phospholipid/cholesterol/gamma-HCH transport system substrate-binding protein
MTSEQDQSKQIEMPKRSFSLEFFVGLFTLLGVGTSGYLAVGLGGLQIMNSDRYSIIAVFDNISGLKNGASVEIAGVPVGEVTGILLNDSVAEVTLNVNNSVKIKDDDIASIRTKGIIGDRYIKISRGASDKFIEPGHKMEETESVIDIEDIIGKIVHSLSGGKDDDKDEDKDDKDKKKEKDKE